MSAVTFDLGDEYAAEELRRAEGRDEPARRRRVKGLLGAFATLHTDLEPETRELEIDECDAASRIEEGDTLEMALEREVARVLEARVVPKMTPRSVTLRLVNAYDDEYAYSLESLPEYAVSAERIYAHLLSFESVRKLVSPAHIRSIARVATVLLLNRRYLARTRKGRAAESPVRKDPPAASPEPAMCLDCGRDLSAPGPGCDTCEKTVL